MGYLTHPVCHTRPPRFIRHYESPRYSELCKSVKGIFFHPILSSSPRHFGLSMCTPRPIYRLTLGRYVDRHISVEGRSIYRPIHRSTIGRFFDRYICRGVHKIHLIKILIFPMPSRCHIYPQIRKPHEKERAADLCQIPHQFFFFFKTPSFY